jgi:peptidoglycan hydrolase-like protein with peptidoglycan-binding domain
VVNDDIVIVDREHHIVAMVPVGSSSGQLEDRGGGGGGGAANVDVVDLSPDEIRQLQIVLNQKGFNIGEPDGVFGPRTSQALIMFQQRQGLQATGRIDSRTVTALGISVRNQGQSPSIGQGSAQPSANQPSASQQGGAPPTTGQGGTQQPGGQQHSASQPSANQPSANQPPANQQQSGQESGPGTNPSTRWPLCRRVGRCLYAALISGQGIKVQRAPHSAP